MSERNVSLGQLLAERMELLQRGNEWTELTPDECDVAMTRLEAIQDAIVNYPFVDSVTKLDALTVLLDSNDASGFADNFKNRLFEALRLS